VIHRLSESSLKNKSIMDTLRHDLRLSGNPSSLIMKCIPSASMQVIWNGETTAAIYIGLHAAWDMGFRRIELESDSKAAIQLINSE
jgi:hypothetical protein